jgi:hypothetical protein
MKKPEEIPLPGEAERLIAGEEAAALAKFRTRDFSGRLNRAIAADGTPGPSRRAARRIPGWVWPAAALFVAAGILAYLAVPKPGPSGEADASARAMLIRLPGLDGLESWAKDTALEPAPLSVSAARFASVLAGMKTVAAEDTARGVPGRANSDGAEAASSGASRPRLGLEKLMEILIRDRAVAKTLSLVSPKFKEG